MIIPFKIFYPLLEFLADGNGEPRDVAARFIAERGEECADCSSKV